MAVKYSMVHILAYVLLVFVQGLQVMADDHCMDGWLRFHDACYWFSHEKGSWAEAVVFCKAINSELADVRSEAENDFLAAEAANTVHLSLPAKLFSKIINTRGYHWLSGQNVDDVTSPVHYWLAGTDTIIEGKWTWVTTGEGFSFSHWGPGEPNGGTGENCLGILDTENYLWNDASCSLSFPFICKKSLNENPPVIG